ncbi:hypothetical protein GOODEAATRI_026983, partial [Goodea atripinnis]
LHTMPTSKRQNKTELQVAPRKRRRLICQTSPGYRSYRRRTACRAALTLTQNNTYRPTASPRDVDPTLSWELGHEAETKREKKRLPGSSWLL